MAKSLDEFGIPSSIITAHGPGPFNRDSSIVVACACGAEAELKIGSVLRTMKRAGCYRCLSCGMKEKHRDDAYQERHRSGVVRSWSKERREQQSETSKQLWKNDRFKEQQTEVSKRIWGDEEKRAEASAKARELWTDDTFRAKHKLAVAAPNTRKAISKAVRNMWESPEYVELQRQAKASPEYVELQRRLAMERHANPSYRKHVSDSLKMLWADNPALKKEMSDRISKLWEDPDYLEKQARAATDPKLIARKSSNAKAQWQRPATRQAIINGIKKIWESPIRRALASKTSKQMWQNDEFRKKQAESRSKLLSDGKDSILERTVQTLLDTLGVPYIRHYIVGYFEFDLFIPSHNILIECNGEYWHSLRKDRDAAKFSYIDTYFPDYRILYLWERDFLNPNLIRHKLINSLFKDSENNFSQVDFSFDDVSIRKMSTSEIPEKSFYSSAEEFLQSFHYAGFGRSAKLVYGAYVGEKLVGVCKFCSPIRKEVASSMGLTFRQVLELDRFCLHPEYQKKNFATWFMSRCSKLAFNTFPDVVALTSFADSTFGHLGTIYKAANWQQVHVVPPDYHYVSSEGFIVHKKTLYDHAVRNGSKETEYADKFGYVKAFGKSKIKFRLDRA